MKTSKNFIQVKILILINDQSQTKSLLIIAVLCRSI